MPPDTKKCSNCKVERPISQFNYGKGYKDGFKNVCRVCDKARQKEYYKKTKEQQRQKRFEKDKDKLVMKVMGGFELYFTKSGQITAVSQSDLNLLGLHYCSYCKKLRLTRLVESLTDGREMCIYCQIAERANNYTAIKAKVKAELRYQRRTDRTISRTQDRAFFINERKKKKHNITGYQVAKAAEKQEFRCNCGVDLDNTAVYIVETKTIKCPACFTVYKETEKEIKKAVKELDWVEEWE